MSRRRTLPLFKIWAPVFVKNERSLGSRCSFCLSERSHPPRFMSCPSNRGSSLALCDSVRSAIAVRSAAILGRPFGRPYAGLKVQKALVSQTPRCAAKPDTVRAARAAQGGTDVRVLLPSRRVKDLTKDETAKHGQPETQTH